MMRDQKPYLVRAFYDWIVDSGCTPYLQIQINYPGVVAPEGFDGEAIYKNLRNQFGITGAGGQDQLKGKVFRVSHMGYADTFDVITAISGIEMVLGRMGYKGAPLGSGVAKAQEVLMQA